VRLKQIKLAGFKSFVDPTSFEVPSQLVGVVGPNGCGKSNIMDAVRWVLGESRASELRGESMQDVIFNGSDLRKPASRASVELVFDNTLGRVGGSWGTFAELSVKRILTRDGQSAYSINNQVVRRKDVHDIFLGTGLGPRAYAIIGQGTISRIIEARPEDLRIFLEEAAGVSKYKERRRETENRLQDTRENLTRVDDILRELNAQLEKLERQAEVAQQFKNFETDRDLKLRMSWIMHRDEATQERDRQQAQIAAAQTELEETMTKLRSFETQLDGLREEQYKAADHLHSRQAAYYEKSSAVASIEAQIRMVVDSRDQLTRQLATLNTESSEAKARQSMSFEQTQNLTQGIEEAAAIQEQLLDQADDIQNRLSPAEQALVEANLALDKSRNAANEISTTIDVTAARRQAVSRQIENLQLRLERLQADRKQVQSPDPAELARFQEQLIQAEQMEAQSLQSTTSNETQWRGLDAQRGPAQEALRASQAKLAQIDARTQALKQLQERAQSQSKVGPWLEKHGLNKLSRLWQKIQIETGWETAVEAVLREQVAALEVGSLDLIAKLSHDAPPGKAVFFTAGAADSGSAAAGNGPSGSTPLAKFVRSSDGRLNAVLADWLANTYCVDSVEAAMRMSKELAAGAVLVTKQGHRVTRSGIQFHATEGEQEGLLARQQELESLTREHRAQQMLADDERARVAALETGVAAALAAFTQFREKHAIELRALSAIRLETQRLEQINARSQESAQRIDAQISETRQELEALNEENELMAEQFDQQDASLADRQEALERDRENLHQVLGALEQVRQTIRDHDRKIQEAAFGKRALQGQLEQLGETTKMSGQMLERAVLQIASISAQLVQLNETTDQAGLQAALEGRVNAEKALSQAREQVDTLNHKLREIEEGKQQIERSQEPLRTKVSEIQLKEQAARLAIEQYAIQLTDAQTDEAAVLAAFEAAPPKLGWLKSEVSRLNNAIGTLGPVNLAALDELKESRDRQVFLTTQLADLTEAITTLEDAIRKIDIETRELLKGTFDNVNEQFGQLFPKLFGGGEARLVLTGDEILNSGVQVMAQPPGKRNATIHLLSGGEKALTAIALVFAMFHLNPAPFCLLDEVDAPLDDANTERYANMVREMSAQTQFLFITHNKIAMELAQQLIGVTMQEKGVSRIVAVDLEVAAQMLEAA
jgi:chromosome segregation protein